MSSKYLHFSIIFNILTFWWSQILFSQDIKNDSISKVSPFLESEVTYFSIDSSVVNILEKKIYLYHKAQVNYQDIELQAEYIVLDWQNNTVFAIGISDSIGNVIGRPIFKQGNETYNCESILYNFNTKQGKIKQMKTQDGEGYIHGEELKKIADNSMFIQESKYTTCSEDDPHFYISAKKLKVIPGKKIISGTANLIIADIPTPLFIPFGFFPIQDQQSSGFIMPTYGYSVNQGYNLTNGGWYFAVSDYMDLAIRAGVFSLGSWRTKVQSSYKKRYGYNGTFSLSYSKNLIGDDGLSNFQDNRDFFINWVHNQDNKAHPNRRFSAKVNAGSSSFNQLNSNQTNDYLKNTLTSNISFNYSFPNKPFNLSTNFRHSQNTLNNSISLSLPDLAFTMNRVNPFQRKLAFGKKRWYENINLSYTANAKNQIETIDSLLFKSETLNKMKYGIQHRVPISSTFKLFNQINVTPNLNYTERWYFNRIEQSWNEESFSVDKDTVGGFRSVRDFNTGFKFNTKIYGIYSFKSDKIKALRHIITPSISFSYRPDFSNEKWGYYDWNIIDSLGNEQRYSFYQEGLYGTAPSGKSGNISFNLDNNLEIKVLQQNDSIIEYKKIAVFRNLNFRSNYNLAADSFNLSNITFNGRTELIPNMNFKFDGVINPYEINDDGTLRNEFAWNNRLSLGRITNFSFTINWSLKNSMTSDNKPIISPENQNELNMIKNQPQNYVDFNIPWDLGIDYKYNYSKPGLEKNIRKTFNVKGNVKLTNKWKIGFHSGYDFDNKEISFTSLDFYRDLHCWEMRFNWIPFGFRQSFNLSINVKSSILQDLKLNKRKTFYDF